MPKLYFVVHPMNEPKYGWSKIGSRITISWNTTKPHRRKYIKRKGEYLFGKKRTEADLYFWGEYEPQTEGEFKSRPDPPKAIHDVLCPVRGTGPIPVNALNTDPYVFGNHFKHVCCGIRKHKTYQYLPNDIVIFGRVIKGGYFEFDTVFVVEKTVDINPLLNSTQYFKASIEPLRKSVSYYYQGLPYSNIDDPFCFVPCSLSYSKHARPKLELAAFGSSVYKQGFLPRARAVKYKKNSGT